MELIDAHGHLGDEKFDDVTEVVKRAVEAGVKTIVCSAVNLLSSQMAIDFSKQYDCVYANVGFHPENVDEWNEKSASEIEKLAKHDKVLAIGEIGLDYHFRDDNKDLQKEVFEKQVEIANKLSKPIVVHTRDSMGDTIEVLRKHKVQNESLMHCFSGSLESAKILMKLGFSFSFGGLVTFKNAKNVQELVKELPMDRILLETDCPYMTPEPFRGQRNEPKNIVYIADAISRIKGISIEEVAKVTTENAKRVFKL